jgi:multidrug efflux pump subunit AcrA (membrane-fusion protein)
VKGKKPMALKTVIETTDGLDEAIAAFYTEQDGKFILQLEGVDEHPEVTSLRNAYARTKEDREKAKSDAAKLKAQIDELQAGAPDTAATQAKITALEERLAAKEAEAGEWRGKYTGVTRDQSLQSALQLAGIQEPAFIKAATAMLAGQVKLGDDGTAYVDGSMGPKVLGDYVKQWASGEGAAFVTKPQGAGVKGGETAKAKTISRAEFEALNADKRMATIREGITIAD